jgi:hypothetical protein
MSIKRTVKRVTKNTNWSWFTVQELWDIYNEANRDVYIYSPVDPAWRECSDTLQAAKAELRLRGLI